MRILYTPYNIIRQYLPAVLLTMSGLLSAHTAFAQSADADNMQAEIDKIKSVLTTNQPDMLIQDVSPSPVPGMYVVTVMGLQTIYVSADAKYFIAGDLFESRDDGVMINAGETMRNNLRSQLISQIPESEMIVYPAEGESVATLNVFTDLDCPYCRQFHGDIAQLTESGITVRYLAFPREGLEGETYDKMVSTWCSDRQKLHLTTAKRGADIPSATCENPVAKHYTLGHQIGIQGTPALVLETGELLNGYVPADTLIGFLVPPAQE